MALKGIVVLELAGLAPAPFCGMVLRDFGATVIRISRIDGNIKMDPLAEGKKNISINLKKQEGIGIVQKLSKDADVLVEPFRPGVMESLGLGPKILQNDNPRLIYARLTGFGQYGFYAKHGGHDINYIAISGLLSLFGRYGEKPIFPVNTVADFAGGGLLCAFGILLALIERNKSGLGQVIDCNMTLGSAYIGSWFYRSRNLPIWGNPRGKNVLDSGAHFYEVYETKDSKYMAVGAIESQFYEQLLQGLGLNDHEAFDFEAMKTMFTEGFLTKTQKEWCEVFDKLDACVTPVLSLDEAPMHQHHLDQDAFIECGGKYAPKPAPQLSRTPGISQFGQTVLEEGEDTKEILKNVGYSDSDIEQLENTGVIRTSIKPSSKL